MAVATYAPAIGRGSPRALDTMHPPTPEPPRPARHRRVAIAAVVLVLLAAGFLVFQQAIQPDVPSAFYTPPAVLPAGPPGTVIRSQPVRSTSPAVDVHRVLYTSTGPDGMPTAVSGIVAAPAGPPPEGGWPVVAWAHGTTGIVPRCAPSLNSDAGVGLIPGFASLVADGYVVVATDYVGLGTPGIHPYLVGESEGRAVLDSVRAARSLLGGATSADTVIFGHSQGGHATLFAAALAPSYAPELHLLGAAPMAPPTDLGKLMELDIGEPPGLLLTALTVASWSKLYPTASEDAIVHAVARPLVADVGDHCVITTDEGDLSELPALLGLKVTFLSADPVTAPGWRELIAANSPGPAKVTVPLLVAQGLADTMVRPEVTTAYVDAQCAAGASIQFDTYPGVGHFQVRTVAAPDVLAWLRDRLGGTPAAAGCTTNVAPSR